MTEETPVRKALKQILEQQAFEMLDPYSDQKLWSTMSLDERQLLAHLFIQAAEHELMQPKTEDPFTASKKSFQMATTLVPSDPQIWYRRGCSLMTQSDLLILEEASLCFEKAVSLDETFFDAWYAAATVWMHRAGLSQDLEHVMQAKIRFQKAESLIREPDQTVATFYWHYGLMWQTLARFSGEASDYHESLLYFRKAKSLGISRRDFSHDCATTLTALSQLINNPEMLHEAIEDYKRSLDIGENRWETNEEISSRYLNLGCCYQHLFEKNHETATFNEARECFHKAILHQPNSFEARLAWGALELFAAKLWQSVDSLEKAIEKLSEAEDYMHNSSTLFAYLSESYSLHGYHEEELDTLQHAEALAKKAITLAPHSAHSRFASALAAYQLGRYFSEPVHFEQAIEHAREGLLLQENHAPLWHILAVAKFSISEMNEDVHLLEEALVCFQKAMQSDLSTMGCFWNDWGIALLSMAEMTQEVKYVQEAIEKFEVAILRQEPMHIEWLTHYASAFELYGDLTDEEEAYEKAIQILMHVTNSDPENHSARYQLAMCWSHLGELRSDLASFQRATEELQKVVQLDPEDDMARCDLGLVFVHVAAGTSEPIDGQVKKSLYELAEQHFLQAQALGNQFVYYHLACLYSLQNNFPDAVHYLEKAFDCQLLPSLEDMMEDEWLAPLLSTSHFQNFIKKLTASS